MTGAWPPDGRIILLVDVNAMFASCHAAEDPSLQGLPVVVAGDPADRRSIVLTASYEARALGIRTAMPLSRALALAPEVTVVAPERSLYRRYHHRMRTVLERFTPDVEAVSIDECFLDITGCPCAEEGAEAAARRIRRAVRDGSGLTVAVGASVTRYLAKTAATLAKGEAEGVLVLLPDDVPKTVHPLPIGALHGVGAKTVSRLEAIGIRTAGDLASAPDGRLRAAIGTHGPALKALLAGAEGGPVSAAEPAPQSLSHEMTFRQDIPTRDGLHPVLLALADHVAARLRSNGAAATTVSLTVRNAAFEDRSRQRGLERPSALSQDLYAAAVGLLARIPASAFPCRLARLAANGLVPLASREDTLFPLPPDPREALARAMDNIRGRFGDDTVVWGGVVGSPGESLYGRREAPPAPGGGKGRREGTETSGAGARSRGP